jgi:hypothetical protein
LEYSNAEEKTPTQKQKKNQKNNTKIDDDNHLHERDPKTRAEPFSESITAHANGLTKGGVKTFIKNIELFIYK